MVPWLINENMQIRTIHTFTTSDPIQPNMANVPKDRSMSEYFPYHQCVLLFVPHIVEKL